jgi:hypothetical protein
VAIQVRKTEIQAVSEVAFDILVAGLQSHCCVKDTLRVAGIGPRSVVSFEFEIPAPEIFKVMFRVSQYVSGLILQSFWITNNAPNLLNECSRIAKRTVNRKERERWIVNALYQFVLMNPKNRFVLFRGRD